MHEAEVKRRAELDSMSANEAQKKTASFRHQVCHLPTSPHTFPFDGFPCPSMPFRALRCPSVPFDALPCPSMPFRALPCSSHTAMCLPLLPHTARAFAQGELDRPRGQRRRGDAHTRQQALHPAE